MEKFTIERFESPFTLEVGGPVMVITPYRGFAGASEELARTDRKQGKVVRIKGRATSPRIEVECGNWTLTFNKRGYLYTKNSFTNSVYLERFDPQNEEEIKQKAAAIQQILALREEIFTMADKFRYGSEDLIKRLTDQQDVVRQALDLLKKV